MNWRINLILGGAIYILTYIPRKIIYYFFNYKYDIYGWLDTNLPLL